MLFTRMKVQSAVACAALITLAGCLTTQEAGLRGDSLVFSATGDGPRGEGDWALLARHFEIEANDGRSAYLLHLGDICKGSQSPDEAYFTAIADLFKQSPIPVIFVPGDNEWNDHDDPALGWSLWNKHLLGFESNFHATPMIQHQPERPENLAWIERGVLMIGINLVGGRIHDPDEWKLRHRQNAAWVAEHLRRDRDRVRAAVVFAQAKPTAKHEDFFEPFVKAAAAFEKPVLYLHGDGHRWQHEPQWRAPNLLRVQVDQVARNPPVQVTVTRDPRHPFMFHRRLHF